MAKKKTATAASSRKSPAKKADAPMKSTAATKPAKTEVKASASKPARAAAKRVAKEARPAAPMPLAKRLEQGGMPALKKQMNKIIAVIKADCIGAANGGPAEACFRVQILSLTRTLDSVKKKQGLSFE